jgi:hypothetical protein
MLGTVTDPHDQWRAFHFSQSNPEGPGQGDVAALLRRATDGDLAFDQRQAIILISPKRRGTGGDMSMDAVKRSRSRSDCPLISQPRRFEPDLRRHVAHHTKKSA